MLQAQRPSRKERLTEEVKTNTPEAKRLNAVIEADLYRRIKTHAAHEGHSISDITRKLWLEYLSKHSNEETFLKQQVT